MFSFKTINRRKLTVQKRLTWFYLLIDLYKIAEIAHIGPHHGRKMHKGPLLRGKHNDEAEDMQF